MLQEHPDRQPIHAEAHARPPLAIEQARAEIWHWALFNIPEDASWPLDFDPNSRHQVIKLQNGKLRFERHTEFVALTYFGENAPGPETLDMIRACPGYLLAGARIRVQPEVGDTSKELFGSNRLFGGYAMYDGIELITDFELDEDGLTRYLITGQIEDAFVRGRLVKRMIDLETYRAASMLALPLVRSLQPQLSALEAQTAEARSHLSEGAEGLDRAIAELAGLLRETGELKSRVRYRIAASRAYGDIVTDRLDSLSEEPVGFRQTLRGFVKHRLSPGMASVRSFNRRLEELSEEIEAAMGLARTQLDHIAQKQSQDLLASMDARARQQVQLGQAVDSFSVAAITYYAVGLLAYALKGLPDIGVSDEVLIAISIVPIALAVFLVTRRLRDAVLKLID